MSEKNCKNCISSNNCSYDFKPYEHGERYSNIHECWCCWNPKEDIIVSLDGRDVKLSDLTDQQLIRLKNQEVK